MLAGHCQYKWKCSAWFDSILPTTLITNLSITWVTKNLEAITTRFLKWWSGLARNTATHQLNEEQWWSPPVIHQQHLQKDQVWRGCLPDVLSWLYCAVHCQLEDSGRRDIHQGGLKAPPGSDSDSEGWPWSLKRQIIRRVKNRITAADNHRRLEDCKQLKV